MQTLALGILGAGPGCDSCRNATLRSRAMYSYATKYCEVQSQSKDYRELLLHALSYRTLLLIVQMVEIRDASMKA